MISLFDKRTVLAKKIVHFLKFFNSYYHSCTYMSHNHQMVNTYPSVLILFLMYISKWSNVEDVCLITQNMYVRIFYQK
jgi:hypothetical protein